LDLWVNKPAPERSPEFFIPGFHDFLPDYLLDQGASIAPTGHAGTHAPQSMQTS
jgi:hypothetical protein